MSFIKRKGARNIGMNGLKNTNCKNCGAPLKFDIKNHFATCKYCGTEYHLDDLGRVKEYQVELEIFGEKRKFYISKIMVEPSYVAFRDMNGDLTSERIGNENIKIELINY